MSVPKPGPINVLSEPVIRVRLAQGNRAALTLPVILAALARDEVESFVALRPHQRHAWHAFLVQLSAIALHHARTTAIPGNAADWMALLRNLTPGFPAGEPWSLIVEDTETPALLQPPLAGGTVKWRRINTPDGLDMLITSRNHDLKSEIMACVEPDDWLFALLSLQTQEGFVGAGNYGISRMNGGFGSRPGLGVAPPGGHGARWRRDLELLVAALGDPATFPKGFDLEKGLALVWLAPWDGVTRLRREDLHPLYVEICRRVRLTRDGERIVACITGSGAPRIAADSWLGDTGDPWTPIGTKDHKALSMPAGGFTYTRLASLLFGREWRLPLLAEPCGNDPREGLSLVASVIVRGQGKTEGFHQRTIPIPPAIADLLSRPSERDAVAHLAWSRIDAMAELQQALTFALRILLRGGTREISERVRRNTFIENNVKLLQAQADLTFFDDLWREVEERADARETVRHVWLAAQRAFALGLIERASRDLPVPVARRLKARCEADRAFHGSLRNKHTWREFFTYSQEDCQ